MELIFFCRITADLCLYFAYAAFLLPYFTDASAGIAPMFVISAASLASFFLHKKRALSLAIMAAALAALLLFGWPMPFIICLPPWIYVTRIVYKEYFGTNYPQQRDSLKRSCFVFLGFIILLAMTAGSGGFDAFASRTLPFVLFFILCAIVQLRLLRPDDPAMRSPGHQLIHAGLMAVITLLGFALSRSGVYGAITRALGFIYTEIIGPVFTFLVTIIATPFFYLLKLLFSLFNTEFDFESISQAGDGQKLVPWELTDEGTMAAPAWLKWIFVSLFAILAVWLLYRFFRMMFGGIRLKRETADEGGFYSSAVREERPSVLRRLQELTGVRGRIRAQFRHFAEKLKKAGLLSPGDTSRRVMEKSMEALPEGSAPDREAWDGFREIYVRARYDERDDAVSASDVTKMKEYAKRMQ